MISKPLVKNNQSIKYIRITFQFKGFHPSLLNKTLDKIIKKAKLMNIFIKGKIYLPTKIKRLTVLKSPHVYKKSREQFELKTYKRLLVTFFEYNDLNKKKSKVFINYIKNCCGGLELNVKYKIIYL